MASAKCTTAIPAAQTRPLRQFAFAMKTAAPATASVSPAEQVEAFIAKFDPANAKLIRECRAEVRALLPTAIELVYDNYNFFVIGYSTTERPSDCIVSIAAAANGVGLSFYYGASLPDPQNLLQGSGKQNRFVRLPSAKTFTSPLMSLPQ